MTISSVSLAQTRCPPPRQPVATPDHGDCIVLNVGQSAKEFVSRHDVLRLGQPVVGPVVHAQDGISFPDQGVCNRSVRGQSSRSFPAPPQATVHENDSGKGTVAGQFPDVTVDEKPIPGRNEQITSHGAVREWTESQIEVLGRGQAGQDGQNEKPGKNDSQHGGHYCDLRSIDQGIVGSGFWVLLVLHSTFQRNSRFQVTRARSGFWVLLVLHLPRSSENSRFQVQEPSPDYS